MNLLGWIGLLLATAVAILIPNILRLVEMMDIGKALPPTNAANCDLFVQEVGPGGKGGKQQVLPNTEFASHGFEDVVYLNPHQAVACAGNLGHAFTVSLEVPHPDCVLIEMPSRKGDYPPTITKLNILGYPFDTVRALFHGISVVPVKAPGQGRRAAHTWTMYVVNHAMDKGGERIDVFELSPSDKSMTFSGSILNELFESKHNGILNDLTVINDNEFFITSYLHEPDNIHGRPSPETIWEKTFKKRMPLMGLLGLLNTKVLHCFFEKPSLDFASPKDKQAAYQRSSCAEVQEGFVMANGISSIPLDLLLANAKKEQQQMVPKDQPTIVVVNDVLAHQLWLFAVPKHTPLGRHPDMHNFANISLQHAADNVELDPFSVTLSVSSRVADDSVGEGEGSSAASPLSIKASFYLGSVSSIITASKIDEDLATAVSPGGVTQLDVEVAFSSPSAVSSAKLLRSAVHDVVMHDGTLLAGTASGLRLRDKPDDESGVIVMGSYCKPGLLICTLKGY